MPVINTKPFNTSPTGPPVSQEMVARFDYKEGSGQFTTETVSQQSFNRGIYMVWGSDAFGSYVNFTPAATTFDYSFQAAFTSPISLSQVSISSWVKGTFLASGLPAGLVLWGYPAGNYGGGAYGTLAAAGTGHTCNTQGSLFTVNMTPYNGSLIHHVVTYDFGAVKLYVNGTLVASSTVTNQPFGSTSTWYHMHSRRYTSATVSLYDTSLWDGVFDQADVTAMYNAERTY